MSDTPFLLKLHEEALALAVRIRAYLTNTGPDGPARAIVPDPLAYARASMLATGSIVAVIAWTLAQRAVLAGEISRAEANTGFDPASDNPLAGHDVDALMAECGSLPGGLCEIVREVASLTERTIRLRRVMLAAEGIAP